MLLIPRPQRDGVDGWHCSGKFRRLLPCAVPLPALRAFATYILFMPRCLHHLPQDLPPAHARNISLCILRRLYRAAWRVVTRRKGCALLRA